MNTNLKNGLINLASYATIVATVGGLGYGVHKVLSPDNKKQAITVTDPIMADQYLQIESDSSRAFFEASQNIQTGNTEAAITEEKPVADISGLCKEMADYKGYINDIIKSYNEGRVSEAKHMTVTANGKEQKIIAMLKDFGYGQQNAETHITSLGDSFIDYVNKSRGKIEAAKQNCEQ